MIVLSFENQDDRKSFSKHYTAKVDIKDSNVLIDGKIFFDVPRKNKEETYQNIIQMSKNNDYAAGNLLDYEYFSNHYKLIAIDLRKHIELENPDLKQQIKLIGTLEEDEVAMFFVFEKSEEMTFEFLQNSLNII